LRLTAALRSGPLCRLECLNFRALSSVQAQAAICRRRLGRTAARRV